MVDPEFADIRQATPNRYNAYPGIFYRYLTEFMYWPLPSSSVISLGCCWSRGFQIAHLTSIDTRSKAARCKELWSLCLRDKLIPGPPSCGVYISRGLEGANDCYRTVLRLPFARLARVRIFVADGWCLSCGWATRYLGGEKQKLWKPIFTWDQGKVKIHYLKVNCKLPQYILHRRPNSNHF